MYKNLFIGIYLGLSFSAVAGIMYWLHPNTDTHHPSITSEIPVSSTSDTTADSETASQQISLETQANSSTISHSMKFQKPNTEWKERDITLNDGRTFHYVFGEGNPEEVALDRGELNTLARKCEDSSQIDELSSLKSCDGDPSGIAHPIYMYPEVEKSLLSALSDPDWEKIFINCSNQFTEIAKSWGISEKDIFEPFTAGFLDIDNLISIQLDTGRKSLDQYRIQSSIDILKKNTDAPCGKQYGSSIIKELESARMWYRIPDGIIEHR